jgi:ubiquinone/menaquinone biosynthesis C-methylase UbiE
MLDRILEPEVMDSADEAFDYDAMDHSAVNRVFVADFLAVWNRREPILDVGTGTAQIPIEFCRQSPIGDIVGIDLADHMLAVGRETVRRLKLDGRIRLEKVNAREMPYASASFAAVMSNSIVHHIPEPRLVFAEIVRVAAPGATIFVRDLLRPADTQTLEKLVDTYAGGDANEHQRKMFADSLHAALTIEEVQRLIGAHGFEADTVRRTSDRHWTWSERRT